MFSGKIRRSTTSDHWRFTRHLGKKRLALDSELHVIRKFMSTSKMLFPLFCAAAVSAQVVPLRDWTVPVSTGKPAIACGDLRSLTSFEYSVVSASVVAATAAAPEHCRVRIFIQPALNIEVKLPTAWNGRLYMFGNGGWAGESFEAPGRMATAARGLKAGFVTASTDTGHSAAVEPGAAQKVGAVHSVAAAFDDLGQDVVGLLGELDPGLSDAAIE